ncbi:hypothetical protein A9Q81_11435 [Gammaproteobacteria bacterium 42_54_T18]|nr:hypothetical protein A9Q81_11435 [Gammaproteobacteria bacterium 42_54_T18]
MRYSRTLNYIIAITAGLNCNTVLAIDFVASASQGIELTDNIHNTENDESSEATFTTSLVTDVNHRSRFVDLSLNYTMGHVRYDKQHLDNTNTVVGAGNATWYMIPNRVEWFVSETENYSIVDRRLADTTDNRTQSSTFSTGPKVSVPLNPVDSATFDATYTQSSTDNNNDNVNGNDNNESIVSSGSVGWSHLLSQTKRFSLEYSKSKTNFDDNDNNTKSSGVSGTLDAETASGLFSIEIGRTKLEIDSGTSTNVNTFDLQYTKNWSTSVFTASAQRELTDTVVSVDPGNATLAGSGLINSSEVEDTVIRNTLDIGLNKPIFNDLTTLDASIALQKEEFQSDKSIQRIKSLNVNVQHRLTEHISLTSGYNYQWIKFDFTDTNRIDREHTLAVGGDYNISADLSVSMELEANLRQVGSDLDVDHSNVKKNSLSCSVSYQFL